MRMIRKYKNRKYYDSQTSGYVTLRDMAVMMRNGEGVKVHDQETHEDITNVTLLQIALKINPTNFPMDIVRNLILTSDV